MFGIVIYCDGGDGFFDANEIVVSVYNAEDLIRINTHVSQRHAFIPHSGLFLRSDDSQGMEMVRLSRVSMVSNPCFHTHPGIMAESGLDSWYEGLSRSCI